MEELTENAEEPDDGDSKKEEQKLGKLQYKVCHPTGQTLCKDMGAGYRGLFGVVLSRIYLNFVIFIETNTF